MVAQGWVATCREVYWNSKLPPLGIDRKVLLLTPNFFWLNRNWFGEFNNFSIRWLTKDPEIVMLPANFATYFLPRRVALDP